MKKLKKIPNKRRIILMTNLVNELAGSLKMPKAWQGMSLDQIIELSKMDIAKDREFDII